MSADIRCCYNNLVKYNLSRSNNIFFVKIIMSNYNSKSKTPYIFQPPKILCVPDGAMIGAKKISLTNRPDQTFFTIHDPEKRMNTKYYPSCPFKRNSQNTGWTSVNPVVISSGKDFAESIAKSILEDDT